MANKNITVTDPIADMLTRIRNAIRARHEEVQIPASKIKSEIAKILVKEGYIKSATEIKDENGHAVINVAFKVSGNDRVVQGLRRISKPGLRVYSAADELPRVLNGLGIAIISTSKGVMTDKAARDQKLGGEVLAYVW
jgi:small subunit ribosomal protein S8